MTAQNRPKPPVRVANSDAKARALEMLALGQHVSTVARELGVRRGTVREWRDSTDGRAFLDREREKRQATYAEAQARAAAVLRDSATSAANALVEGLESGDPETRRRCAEAILDRVGLPKTQKVEGSIGPALDLSKLDDAELEQLATLTAKAGGA